MLVAKATEIFLQKLARDAGTAAALRSATVIKLEDILEARQDDASLRFLESVLPAGVPK